MRDLHCAKLEKARCRRRGSKAGTRKSGIATVLEAAVRANLAMIN